MQFETIADIYAANDKIRQKFIETVSDLTEDQENLSPGNGQWTLGEIVEHVAKVDRGMTQICHRLLSKAEAEGKTSDGSAKLSKTFVDGITKVETEEQKLVAPEVVQPEGGKPVADSLAMLKENRVKLDGMKTMFETVDGTTHTFPHPAFGPLTAQDWLALLGGHEMRHTRQIKRILARK
jgi:uncharacterized damage-inducible protein DinB